MKDKSKREGGKLVGEERECGLQIEWENERGMQRYNLCVAVPLGGDRVLRKCVYVYIRLIVCL